MTGYHLIGKDSATSPVFMTPSTRNSIFMHLMSIIILILWTGLFLVPHGFLMPGAVFLSKQGFGTTGYTLAAI